MARTGKKRKPRAVRYVIEKLPDKADKNPANPYAVLEAMRQFHSHLEKARIAIAWRLDVKADRDGRLWLGQLKKASDLDRELKPFDLVILLNHYAWDHFSQAQRHALVDHELMHAQVVIDSDGELVKDERGRQCYRTRKHDLEEFRDIVYRHGAYKEDLVDFVTMLRAREKNTQPLLDGLEEGEVEAEPMAAAAKRSKKTKV